MRSNYPLTSRHDSTQNMNYQQNRYILKTVDALVQSFRSNNRVILPR